MTTGRNPHLYEVIGRGYARHRQPDPRIARAILMALGTAPRIVNVGAGAGSYEPEDRQVVAVEPSLQMIRQRPASAAPVVRAAAERLPFADRSFDAAMALLTIHHWSDCRAGLGEMRRVARERIVVLTWDPSHPGFWLVQDYFPDLLAHDRRIFPTLAELESILGEIEVRPVLLPHDCTDGFLGAYWRRPEAYLDPGVRSAISSFSRVEGVAPRLERLQRDLESGHWQAHHADLLRRSECDLGYRLVVARGAA